MGFVKNLFAGNQGGGWNASNVPIEQGVNVGQATDAYGRSMGGLDQQQAFLNALQGQGGLANQASVFNQQQALANQLQGVANGTGPNPAMAQLANTTGQNIAAQASLMGGQRGIGANTGLLARQLGQQGANLQQQAVGQGAALSAQQQLAAMGALQNQQGMMGNLANAQVGQQAGALGAYNQYAQNEQANLLNALGQYNQSRVGMQSSSNSANAGIQAANARGQQGLIGGLMGGAASAFAAAHGGMVPQHYADGGLTLPQNNIQAPTLGNFQLDMGNQQQYQNLPTSFAANNLKEVAAPAATYPNQGMMSDSGENPIEKGSSQLIGAAAKAGMMALMANSGAVVPGAAPVKGDSLKNDTVPAMLSPKEIVIPRSITMSKDAPEKAKQFVAAVLARNGMGKKK